MTRVMYVPRAHGTFVLNKQDKQEDRLAGQLAGLALASIRCHVV